MAMSENRTGENIPSSEVTPEAAPAASDAIGAVAGTVGGVAGVAKHVPGIGAAAAGVQACADVVGNAARIAGKVTADVPVVGEPVSGAGPADQVSQVADAAGKVAGMAKHLPGPVGTVAKVASAVAPMASKVAKHAAKAPGASGAEPGGGNLGKMAGGPLGDMARSAGRKWMLAHLLPIICSVVLMGLVIAIPLALTQCSSSAGSANKSTERTEMAIPRIANMSADYAKPHTPADDIVELATEMASTAATASSPDNRLSVPDKEMHPVTRGYGTSAWTDKDELEVDGMWQGLTDLQKTSMENAFKITDATQGNKASSVGQEREFKWSGNNAYGSCCQQGVAVYAAAVDPDMAPGGWDDATQTNKVIGQDGGGSAGQQATMYYLKQRSGGGYDNLYEDLGRGNGADKLEPGDILVNESHVAIFVGNENETVRSKFPDTPGNVFEAAFGDGKGPKYDPAYSRYPGINYHDDTWLGDFNAFRITDYNYENENYDGKILDWRSIITSTLGNGKGKSDGSPDDSANGTQQAIVDASYRVGSPGSGLCAKWVSQVYQAAGFRYPGGNANDMYNNWCTSSDKADLKVGMIVAVSTHTRTGYMGQTYGHVGIYIGNGKVRENVGHIQETDLDRWIEYYGTTVPPKWGWAGGNHVA